MNDMDDSFWKLTKIPLPQKNANSLRDWTLIGNFTFEAHNRLLCAGDLNFEREKNKTTNDEIKKGKTRFLSLSEIAYVGIENEKEQKKIMNKTQQQRDSLMCQIEI